MIISQMGSHRQLSPQQVHLPLQLLVFALQQLLPPSSVMHSRGAIRGGG
jgi:hypothetical protein